MGIDSLAHRLEGIGDRLGAEWGLAYHHLESGERFERNADHLFTTASSIKIAILLELYRRAEAGEIDVAEPFTLRAGVHDTPGSGVLKDLRWPLTVTLYDVAMLMIIVSDNVATNILIDRLGMDTINAGLRAQGVDGITLRRRMQDMEAIAAGRENLGSPAAFARLLARIERREALSAESCEAVLDILKRTQSTATLRRFLPEGTVVAHKPGGLPGVVNDAGIIYGPTGAYALCIYVQGCRTGVEGQLAVGAMSGVVWEHVTGEDLPAMAWLGL